MLGQSVLKMLSPEEAVLFESLKSTIAELDALQAGNQAEAPVEMNNEELMKAIKKLAGENLGDSVEDGKEEEDKDVKKEDNGPTSNDSADEKLKNQTDINDGNMSEVGKALLQLLQKTTKPAVAKGVDSDAITNAVAKALSPVVSKINEIEKFNTNMLDSLGFADKIEKSVTDQPVQKGLNNSSDLPVQSTDANSIVNEFLSVLKAQVKEPKQEFRNDWNGIQKERQDLRKSLPFIFKDGIEKLSGG